MARNSYEIELSLRDRNVRRGLADAAAEARTLDNALGDAESAGRAVARAIEASADDMQREIAATRSAITAMEQALDGVDVNPTEVVADLKRIGLTAEDIEADAEALADAIKRVDDVKLTAAQHGFDDVGDAVGRVRDQSDKANNAARGFLGNVAGDAVQAAVPIGGLGESVSQMVEGLAEGEIGMKGLVTAGAGMAGIGVATWIISDALRSIKARQEEIAERARRWRDALEGAESTLEAITEMTAETDTFTDNQVEAFNRLGLSVGDVNDLLGQGRAAVQAWYDEAIAAAEYNTEAWWDTRGAMTAMTQQLDAMEPALADVASRQTFLADAIDDTNDAARRNVRTMEDAERQTRRARDAARDAATEYDRLRGALSQEADLIGLRRTFAEFEGGREDILRTAEATASYLDRLGDIPPTVKTNVLTLIDRGELQTALFWIETLSRKEVRIPVNFQFGPNVPDAIRRIETGRYASGTMGAAPGLAIVGEQGPELVDLPAGARVRSADETRRIVAGPSGSTTVINHWPAGARPADVARATRRYGRAQGPT